MGAFVAGFVWNTAMMLDRVRERGAVQVDAGAGHHHVLSGGALWTRREAEEDAGRAMRRNVTRGVFVI